MEASKKPDYTAWRLCYVLAMAESRREFFGRFWGGGTNNSPKRMARYEVLETYARTQLLPYDFALSIEQERELMAHVRGLLEGTSNEVLFSNLIRGQIEELVQAKIDPWRHRSNVDGREEKIWEIRLVAPDYVSSFLNDPAHSDVVERL